MLDKIYKKLDTKSLIDKCIKKDPLAWAEFISRYSPFAHGAIRKRLQNHGVKYDEEDIKDLQQDLFMKLWQENSLQNLKNSSNINFWICMVSANFASDFYRRSRKDILGDAVSIFEEMVIKNKTIALENLIKSNLPSPRKRMEHEVLEEKIKDALSELRPKEKIAVKLNIFHDKKYKEIAKILKLSIGNVASVLKRAKSKIRKKLQ